MQRPLDRSRSEPGHFYSFNVSAPPRSVGNASASYTLLDSTLGQAKDRVKSPYSDRRSVTPSTIVTNPSPPPVLNTSTLSQIPKYALPHPSYHQVPLSQPSMQAPPLSQPSKPEPIRPSHAKDIPAAPSGMNGPLARTSSPPTSPPYSSIGRPARGLSASELTRLPRPEGISVDISPTVSRRSLPDRPTNGESHLHVSIPSRQLLPPPKSQSPSYGKTSRLPIDSFLSYDEEPKLYKLFSDDRAFEEFSKSITQPSQQHVDAESNAKQAEKESDEISALADVTEKKLKSMRVALSKYSTQLKDAAKNKDTVQFAVLLGQLDQDYSHGLKQEENVSPNAQESAKSSPLVSSASSPASSPHTRRLNSSTDNPISLAHELQGLTKALKDKLKDQPKMRELEFLSTIREQYNRDLELIREHEAKSIEELTAIHQNELAIMEYNHEKRLQEIQFGFDKYVKQLEDRINEGERRFTEFEKQKVAKELNETKAKYHKK